MPKNFFRRLGFGRRDNPFARLSRDLLEFSQAFSSISDMSTLVPSVMGKIRDLAGIDEIALFLFDHDDQRYKLVHSRGIELKPHLRIRGNYYFTPDDRLVRWLLTNRYPLISSEMHDVLGFLNEEERDVLRFVSTELCIPLEAHNRFIGMLCLGRKRGGRDYDADDIQLLVVVAAQAALAFENNRLQNEAIERERMRRELEIAGELQKRLLPDVPPRGYRGFDISGICIPCTEVGGDYFDYLPLNERQLGLVIGDVAGHGMRAGLLMGMAKSCLSTVVSIDPSCLRVMNALNTMICNLEERHIIMTFFYSIIDTQKNLITFANAGHLYPYIYRKKGDSLENLGTAPSYPLGVRASYPYIEQSAKFQRGDFMLFYSDGFVESLNRKEEQFGFERLEKSIMDHRKKSAQRLAKGIITDLFDFLASEPHQDDLTIVALKTSE